MYERRAEALLPRSAFLRRLILHTGIAMGLIFGSLGVGMLGYHYLAGLSWIDSLLNSSMLLGGMGPTDTLYTTAGKLFASFYALYSGLIFLVAVGIIFAPVFHRIVHRFHLDDVDAQDDIALKKSTKKGR